MHVFNAVWKTRMHTKPFTFYPMWLQILRGMVSIFLACFFSSPLMADPSRPNVLLILSDDHSVPHISCYDDVNTTKFHITPNLQKFAEQGMRFDRAYTTAPQCAPSRISIFACRSGRHVSRCHAVAVVPARWARPRKLPCCSRRPGRMARAKLSQRVRRG
jgi:hypothetical protein